MTTVSPKENRALMPKKHLTHTTKKTIKKDKAATKTYRYRKYNHVTKLYKRVALPITKICIKYKVPPGAVLSIIALESGWEKGYIGQITGNYLSLNAVGNDPELPALRMPKNRATNAIILDKKKLMKTSKSNIIWEDRPPSLKKDYRPDSIAGTTRHLDFFINHPDEMTKANLKNVKDFVSRFISYTSKIKAYREARSLLDQQIGKKGIDILFDPQLNKKFTYTIGGKPNSYNFRETWPKKVMSISKNTGINNLCRELYLEEKTFKEAW